MNERSIFEKIHKFINFSAFIPSVIVALIHFKLSVLVGVQANKIFQHWFDTGELPTGSDEVVRSVDSFLAKPIPSVFLAKYPAESMPFEWWLATVFNSICWGLFVYLCYKLSHKLFKIKGQ